MKSIARLAALIFLAATIGCNKEDTWHRNVLQALYKVYKQGEIDECRLNGKLVYVAGLNAYDAGAEIVDTTGRKLGSCNYAWGQVDSICKQLKSCEVVYRCEDHITGQPFVDKYGLSR